MLGSRRSLRATRVARSSLFQSPPSVTSLRSLLPSVTRNAFAVVTKRYASFPGGQFPGMKFPGQPQVPEKGATLKQYVSNGNSFALSVNRK